jgi:hypothetical protein
MHTHLPCPASDARLVQQSASDRHQAQVATICKITAVFVGTDLDKLIGHFWLLFC